MAVEMKPGIVLIEDDPDIREVIEDLLIHEGYTVDSFENGQEALERFHECRNPQVILLDLIMPVMDGWSFLRGRAELAEMDEPIASVPCCVITAAANPQILSLPGIQCCLKKPVDAEAILAIVERNCSAPSSPQRDPLEGHPRTLSELEPSSAQYLH